MLSFSEEELREFRNEAEELLDSAERCLLQIGGSQDFKTCFDSVFRCFHNLKGASGMMELVDLQAHTHQLETLLIEFKDGSSIPEGHVSLFLRGIDAARILLRGEKVEFDYQVEKTCADDIGVTSAAEKQNKELSSSETPRVYEISDEVMDEFISEMEESIESISKKLQTIERGVYEANIVDELYREVHSLKGSAYLFSFKKLGEVAHAMESSLEPIRRATHRASSQLINCLFRCIKVIESLAAKIKSGAGDEAFAEIVPQLVGDLANITEHLEPITDSPKKVEATQGEVKVTQSESKEKIVDSQATVPAVSKERESEGVSSIRVPVSLLDNLMVLMGEMVLVRNQVLQYSSVSDDLEFSSMSKRLNVVTSEIQAEMMKTRMQPISNVLEKFSRLVRDLSRELNKSIGLTLEGAETELDKSLLEAIKDPLTHIVRNACDHGIESPEVRAQAGKPKCGTIAIRAYYEGGQVVIDVSDDGRGLSRERLIAKALEKGIITSHQAGQLTDKEAFALIFMPGFSTAERVTNVSGRGVGMDVVRNNVEKIGGMVELSGRAGVGTSIKMKIPLTLAIVPALIVRCGAGKFAIPQIKIEELVRADPESESRIEILHGAPVYRLRGNIIPLVDLGTVLGIRHERPRYVDSISNIVILNAETVTFGVIIDEVQDTVDIVVKPLNRILKSLQVYSGATILGDGTVALIFDVLGISKFVQISQEQSHSYRNSVKNSSTTQAQEFLLIRLNSPVRYAMVLNYVQRLEKFEASRVECSGDERVIRYRDGILPIISLNAQLGFGEMPGTKDRMSVVVVERAGVLYGIEVDEIVDTFSTELELIAPIKSRVGISGNIGASDGLIVVVDPFEVIRNVFDHDEIGSAFSDEALKNQKIVKKEGTILLVEDTVYFRKVIKGLLEKWGYQVVTAQDGKEALEVLNRAEDRVVLIVSDIEMPRMNGFELAKEIRKRSEYSTIPMLAVSSKGSKEYQEEGIRCGFDRYLEKLRPEILMSAVEELTVKQGRVA